MIGPHPAVLDRTCRHSLGNECSEHSVFHDQHMLLAACHIVLHPFEQPDFCAQQSRLARSVALFPSHLGLAGFVDGDSTRQWLLWQGGGDLLATGEERLLVVARHCDGAAKCIALDP